MIRAQRNGRIRQFAALVGITLVLPVFFQVGRGGIALSSSYAPWATNQASALASLPISVFVLPVLLLVLALRTNGRLRHRVLVEDVLVAGYLIINTAALGLGIVLGVTEARPATLTFGQTLFPISAYVVGRLLCGAKPAPDSFVAALRGSVTGAVTLVCATMVLYVIQTIFDGGSGFRWGLLTDHIGPFYNYKMKRFYPLQISVSLVFLTSYVVFRRKRTALDGLAFGMVLLGISFLVLMHSRTAVLFVLLGVALSMVRLADLLRFRVRRRLVTLALIGALAVPIGWQIGSLVGARSVLRLADTATALLHSGRDLDAGDERRFDLIARGFMIGFSSPVGGAYKVESRHGLRRIVNSESGYLDVAVRAGPIALLFIILLIGRSFQGVWAIRSAYVIGTAREQWLLDGIVGVMGAFGLVSHVWLNSLTEPYVAPLYWLLLGLVVTGRIATRPQQRRLSVPISATTEIRTEVRNV